MCIGPVAGRRKWTPKPGGQRWIEEWDGPAEVGSAGQDILAYGDLVLYSKCCRQCERVFNRRCPERICIQSLWLNLEGGLGRDKSGLGTC